MPSCVRARPPSCCRGVVPGERGMDRSARSRRSTVTRVVGPSPPPVPRRPDRAGRRPQAATAWRGRVRSCPWPGSGPWPGPWPCRPAGGAPSGQEAGAAAPGDAVGVTGWAAQRGRAAVVGCGRPGSAAGRGTARGPEEAEGARGTPWESHRPAGGMVSVDSAMRVGRGQDSHT